MKGMKKWNEEVDKRKILNQNNNGNNATNVERQNSNPLTKDQMDNRGNFNRGNADTITDLPK